MTSHLMAKNSNKFAFLVSSFRSGGGEKQMVEMANAFAAQGYTVDLLTLSLSGNFRPRVDPRVRLVSLSRGRMLSSLVPLVRYLRRERPVAILALDSYTHLLALFAKSLSGSDVRVVLRIGIVFSRLFAVYEGIKDKSMAFLIRRLYKRADAVIANSRGVADDIIALTGLLRSKVSVIYNPTDVAEIRAKASGVPDHPWLSDKSLPVVFTIGRLRKQKNLTLLVRAFARVHKELPSRLVIVGEGREEAALRQLAAELGCADDVALVGFKDNPYALMAQADVFVLSSILEGLPNALIDALVCGVPAIAADCDSGPREVLAPESDYRKRLAVGDGVEYGSCGALFAVNDEQALTDALKSFLTDPALRQRYAGASLARGADFDQGPLLEEYKKVLLGKE